MIIVFRSLLAAGVLDLTSKQDNRTAAIKSLKQKRLYMLLSIVLESQHPKPHLQISKTKQLFPKTIKRQIISGVCGSHFKKSPSEHIPVRCNGLTNTLLSQRSTVVLLEQ